MQLIELNTNRLILKGYRPADIQYVFSNYSKPEVMNILGHVNEQAYLKEKDKVDRGYAAYNRDFVMFFLVEKSSGRIMGRCALHNWNSEYRRSEIGYHMDHEEFKRKGFMSEAVEAIMRYGFEELNLNRIDATVSPSNTASLAVMKKFNFTREGLLRQNYWTGDRFDDSIMFSLLRSETSFQ